MQSLVSISDNFMSDLFLNDINGQQAFWLDNTPFTQLHVLPTRVLKKCFTNAGINNTLAQSSKRSP